VRASVFAPALDGEAPLRGPEHETRKGGEHHVAPRGEKRNEPGQACDLARGPPVAGAERSLQRLQVDARERRLLDGPQQIGEQVEVVRRLLDRLHDLDDASLEPLRGDELGQEQGDRDFTEKPRARPGHEGAESSRRQREQDDSRRGTTEANRGRRPAPKERCIDPDP
jgi:hypothetical protein